MFFTSLSLEEERNKINNEYLNAKNSFSVYKAQMSEIFHPPLESFANELDELHVQAKVPTAALIKAFEQTEGFLKGTVTPHAYGRVIDEMKTGQASTHEPTRLSQAMETLSWLVWVLSLACVLSGALLLGVVGLFVSVAIHHDAQHSDVKYPDAHDQQDSKEIAEHMEKIRDIRDCGVPEAVMM